MYKLLLYLGNRLLEMIHENIDRGIAPDTGEPYQYTQEEFFRPFDPDLYKKLKKAGEIGKSVIVRTNKEGKESFLVKDYGRFKEVIYGHRKFLVATGAMLQNMQITRIDPATGEVAIGFPDPEQEQKAYWLNVAGAGRSRRLWRFLGITREQEEQLAKEIEQLPDNLLPKDWYEFPKLPLRNP